MNTSFFATRFARHRLAKLKENNHAMWKSAHADFRTNKVEVEKEIKVGSVEYLEMHEHEDDEDEMAGGEWDAFEEKKRAERFSNTVTEDSDSVGISSTDGRSLNKLIDDLGKIGVESKKLARVLFRLSHSKVREYARGGKATSR